MGWDDMVMGLVSTEKDGMGRFGRWVGFSLKIRDLGWVSCGSIHRKGRGGTVWGWDEVSPKIKGSGMVRMWGFVVGLFSPKYKGLGLVGWF